MNNSENTESTPTPPLPNSPTPKLPDPTPKPDENAIVIHSPMVKVRVLSPAQQIRYAACQEVIASGWATYVQVGLALATIRNEQLYCGEFDNFEQYCRAKWDYGRRYVDQLIAAAQVFNHLRANCSQTVLQVPESEGQVRPLIGLTMEEATQAWHQAVERAPGGKVTGALLKSVVRSIKKAAPVEARPRPRARTKARSASSSRARLANC